MSEPQDAFEDVRETFAGRTLLGCGVALALLLPAWFAATALVIQIDPALNGFQAIADGVSDEPLHELPRLAIWTIGAVRGAMLVAVLVPVAIAGWLLARVIAAALSRRAQRDRERYDDLVRDAAVLRDTDWQEAEEG